MEVEKGKDALRLGVDYLTLSKPQEENVRDVVREVAITLQSTGECAGWKHGYQGVKVCGGLGDVMSRSYGESARGDVLVRLPGRALDWIRDKNLFSESELQCTDADICRFFVERDFGASRIDLAVDSPDPAITPKLIERFVRAGDFLCRARTAGIIDYWPIDKPETKGDQETLIIGKRASSRYMRVYSKQVDLRRRTGVDVGHLTRFELECKGAAGTRVLDLIADQGATLIPSLFRGWISFKDPNDPNPRKDRRQDVDWWARMVGDATPVVLGLTRGATQPEQTLKWIKKGVAKSLVLAEQYGMGAEIEAAKAEKRHKIKEKEKLLWEHYEEQRAKKRTAGSYGMGETYE